MHFVDMHDKYMHFVYIPFIYNEDIHLLQASAPSEYLMYRRKFGNF